MSYPEITWGRLIKNSFNNGLIPIKNQKFEFIYFNNFQLNLYIYKIE